jgi:hypothetical protein
MKKILCASDNEGPLGARRRPAPKAKLASWRGIPVTILSGRCDTPAILLLCQSVCAISARDGQ